MVPSKVTGMGYMKTFLPAEIFPIDPNTLLCYLGEEDKKDCAGQARGLKGSYGSPAKPVHAVAQAGGAGAVIEDMAEVGAAPGAEDFRPHHRGCGRRVFPYIERGDGLIKAGPSCAGIELGGVTKRSVSQRTQRKNTRLLGGMVSAGKRVFGAPFPCHVKLFLQSAELRHSASVFTTGRSDVFSLSRAGVVISGISVPYRSFPCRPGHCPARSDVARRRSIDLWIGGKGTL